MKGMEGMAYEGLLRTLGSPSLEKRRLRGGMALYRFFRGAEEGTADLF